MLVFINSHFYSDIESPLRWGLFLLLLYFCCNAAISCGTLKSTKETDQVIIMRNIAPIYVVVSGSAGLQF
ncbi:MAG: hypothetical protein A3J37_07530 [Alphaproteobacteria bacterium RIFCSPHIGHO2_12_FULL_45_9]|nr:MAG: hypothetical protein A3B66_02125 [Alphaproteobacteria bacterium RIFCSPHIGHO2_02_FULL_46_13]OFW97974.1 MAG: hypothetical protein A3J37_07530 [Alphaproteobacteria bacterium RIFCSPHIGHO2_12_FULL_45_9]